MTDRTGEPIRPATDYNIRYIGRAGGYAIWQDVDTQHDFLLQPRGHPRKPRWVRYTGEGSILRLDGVPGFDSLTPADTCDLYATVEAALANPPEPDND